MKIYFLPTSVIQNELRYSFLPFRTVTIAVGHAGGLSGVLCEKGSASYNLFPVLTTKRLLTLGAFGLHLLGFDSLFFKVISTPNVGLDNLSRNQEPLLLLVEYKNSLRILLNTELGDLKVSSKPYLTLYDPEAFGHFH